METMRRRAAAVVKTSTLSRLHRRPLTRMHAGRLRS
jgi:hypothetical protein